MHCVLFGFCVRQRAQLPFTGSICRQRPGSYERHHFPEAEVEEKRNPHRSG
jgi:hypothetical protein